MFFFLTLSITSEISSHDSQLSYKSFAIRKKLFEALSQYFFS